MSQHVTACHSMSQHVTACHRISNSNSNSMSQHVRAAQHTTTVLALNPLASRLNMTTAKSMLKTAQILRSPATISPFATSLQSASTCFRPIHSRPGTSKSYKSHPLIISSEISIFVCFNRVNRVITGSCFMAVNQLGFLVVNALRPGSAR